MRLPASTSGNADPHYAAKPFRIPEGVETQGRSESSLGSAGVCGNHLTGAQGRLERGEGETLSFVMTLSGYGRYSSLSIRRRRLTGAGGKAIELLGRNPFKKRTSCSPGFTRQRREKAIGFTSREGSNQTRRPGQRSLSVYPGA